MAVTWTTQRSGSWSLDSTNPSSPWYDAGTQTARGRTPGSSSNVNNDTVSIANGHTLTCDASVTIGDVTTPATLSISNVSSGTGILNVSTGVTLTIVSNAQNRGSATWTFSAGSNLVFNSTTALTWTISEALTSPKLVFAGSSGSHCTVTNGSTGKGRFTYTGGSLATASNFEASYADFTGIGDSANTMLLWYGGTGTSARLVLDHCTFTSCGTTQLNVLGATGYVVIDSCTWTSTAATRTFIPVSSAARTSGTRLISNNYFDVVFGSSSSMTDWTFRGNVFAADISLLATGDLAWDEFSGNFWWSNAGSRYLTGATLSSNAWNYGLFHNPAAEITNLHAFLYPSAMTGSVEYSGWILEPGWTGAGGDLFIIGNATSATTVTVQDWLVLPNKDGLKSGKFVSCGTLANLTLNVNHNTVVSDGVGETGVVQYGENTKPTTATIASCRSNLCWDYATNNGMLVQAAASIPSGTCNVSGTAVTGTATKWQTGLNDGNAAQIPISAGDYIRFGSDTAAYQVLTVNSDTSLTLTSSAGSKTGVSWNVLVKDVIYSGSYTAADYNGKWNMATGTDGVGYNSNASYPWFTSFTYSPGPNDKVLSADPFVDKTRGIATWAVYKSLAVSGDTYDTKVNAAVAYIKSSPSVRIAEMVDWIKAGWKVTDSSLNNAGHDGVTIGALDYELAGNPYYIAGAMSGGMFTGG